MIEVNNINSLILHFSEASDKEKKTIETKVCETYTPLVQRIASQYEIPSFCPAANRDDRIQDGFRGLLKALHTYDPSCNTKFLTYAYSCVRKYVYSGVREITAAGKRNSYSNSKLQMYRKIKKDLALKLGRIPSIGELSIETGWRINTVLAYERQLYDVVSFEDLEMSEINI
ncbi:MAG: hypothetical protein II969_08500 [Anaerolineaceae bacterium]|nr:hypothetical protein [Anaerolineaceae bacterium]